MSGIVEILLVVGGLYIILDVLWNHSQYQPEDNVILFVLGCVFIVFAFQIHRFL